MQRAAVSKLVRRAPLVRATRNAAIAYEVTVNGANLIGAGMAASGVGVPAIGVAMCFSRFLSLLSLFLLFPFPLLCPRLPNSNTTRSPLPVPFTYNSAKTSKDPAIAPVFQHSAHTQVVY